MDNDLKTQPGDLQIPKDLDPVEPAASGGVTFVRMGDVILSDGKVLTYNIGRKPGEKEQSGADYDEKGLSHQI